MLNATSIRPAAPLLGVIGLGLTLGALAATEPRFALLAVALLVAPLLVWAPLRISVPLLCVGLGLNFDVVRSGVHVSLPQLIALCVVAAVVVRGLIDANQRTGVWGSAGFLLVFAALPAQLVALDPGAALKGLTQLAVLSVVLFALCVCFASGRVRPERVVPWLLAGVCLSAVFGVYQVVFHVGHPTLVRGGLMRAYATFGQPNAYGQYLAALLPIAITFTHGRAARLGIVAVLVTLLVLTGSRGAWVAAAAGVSVIAYLALWRARPRAARVTAVLAVIAMLLLVARLGPSLVDASAAVDWSIRQRALLLLTAWDAAIAQPFFGYGFDAFAHLVPGSFRAGLTDDAVMAHNALLEVWLDMGMLGLLVFCALVIACFRTALRAWRTSGHPLLAGCIGGFTAYLVSSMFGSPFTRGLQELVVVILALMAALVLRASASESDVSRTVATAGGSL